MDGNVMDVDSNIFRAEGAENVGTICGEFFQIEANGIQVPGRIYFFADRGSDFPGKFAKCRCVLGGDFRGGAINCFPAFSVARDPARRQYP